MHISRNIIKQNLITAQFAAGIRWEYPDMYYFIIQTVVHTIDAKYFPAGSLDNETNRVRLFVDVLFRRLFALATERARPEYPCSTLISSVSNDAITDSFPTIFCALNNARSSLLYLRIK